MRLLIFTQKVDRHDPILGFFHGWILRFASLFEHVTVLCLEKGEYELPSNVEILSLGKEIGSSRLKYIINFYKYICSHRTSYDVVFVHMNEEYLLLGGLLWKLWNKPVLMWRNHPAGNFLTTIAGYLSDTVFYTSPDSYTATFKNAKLMPVGINIKLFKPINGLKNFNQIIMLGRISASKEIDVCIRALPEVLLRHPHIHLKIVGPILDTQYFKKIKKQIQKLHLENKVSFTNSIRQESIPALCAESGLYINTSPQGFMDKTIFETMACGLPVCVCNRALVGIIPDELLFKEGDFRDLATHLNLFLDKSQQERTDIGEQLSAYVQTNYSLISLLGQIKNISNIEYSKKIQTKIYKQQIYTYVRLTIFIFLIGILLFGFPHKNLRHTATQISTNIQRKL